MRHHAFVIVLATTIGSVAFAAKPELSMQSLSVLGVQAGGSSTLDDVVVRLGQAERWHSGDASESEYKICYRVLSESGEVTVIFGSSGEMASPIGQVTSIRLLGPRVAYSQRGRCARMSNRSGPLAVANGLSLGMSQAQVKSLFKQKTTSGNGTIQYQSCKQRHMAETDPAFKNWVGKAQCFENPLRPIVDDCAYVQINFSNGRASSISLSGIQSIC